ncbi:DUF3540 domain-containing protein [Sorangium sp. So ce426]|uniref:DUF3540 domain-containing protein n=1 Tax=Sorangium sp. So ce426 TaxID=3133312 RepID=UPI003F5C0E7D
MVIAAGTVESSPVHVLPTARSARALFPTEPDVTTDLGTVLARAGQRVRVATSTGERDTEIAPSCIVSPAPGDRVLVVGSRDEAYVLAVLRRGHAGETKLVFDRDVSLSVPNGRLRVLAKEGVDLASPEALGVHVGAVEVDAAEVRVAFSSLLDLVGHSITTKTKKVRVVAETFDTIAGRIYQRAVNFLRRTDELDRVEAKNIDRRAENLVHIHGENAVTTAEQLVKFDAAQVHVG